ncbi:hypothetical protein I7I50_01828 [Histoplasma capsulatum G186AR]|uniref:Uncharacterized protein n=1 Tax=Ajellomyces capsulatus TaxID=5037 RepID=A0A8H8CSZ4_AJECA|nr:hypothetical protein I7I52_12042 [Histoplasma capsulatum]QSS71104.1 hypothetical protein I7I50_01828 [Histoplasma capsulatum G186AR]
MPPGKKILGDGFGCVNIATCSISPKRKWGRESTKTLLFRFLTVIGHIVEDRKQTQYCSPFSFSFLSYFLSFFFLFFFFLKGHFVIWICRDFGQNKKPTTRKMDRWGLMGYHSRLLHIHHRSRLHNHQNLRRSHRDH